MLIQNTSVRNHSMCFDSPSKSGNTTALLSAYYLLGRRCPSIATLCGKAWKVKEKSCHSDYPTNNYSYSTDFYHHPALATGSSAQLVV